MHTVDNPRVRVTGGSRGRVQHISTGYPAWRRMRRILVSVMAVTLAPIAPLEKAAEAESINTGNEGRVINTAPPQKVHAYDRYRKRLAHQKRRAKIALGFAHRQIGKPYRWGAVGPRTYDCSGLVMKAWGRAGVRLPRVTYSQYRSVHRKVNLRNLRKGDLIFFNGRSHVGMYVGRMRFIHAPHSGAHVRIDKLDGRRRSRFSGAVRPGAPASRRGSAVISRTAHRPEKLKSRKRTDTVPFPQSGPHLFSAQLPRYAFTRRLR
jgi:cell wall-associated NlpC family hydrolase